MNKDIATFTAVLNDVARRPAKVPKDFPHIQLQIGNSDMLPYVRTPESLSIHRIRNLDLGDSKAILSSELFPSNYTFEEIEALQGSKTFIDWKQYSLYGRATFARYRSPSILQVDSIQSVEALFSIAPYKHIVLHHDFSEFYVSEFWTSETFLNAALDYYQISASELVRIDWKTDSAKSCTFILTFLRQSLAGPRYQQLSSMIDTSCYVISHYDFVRSTSLEEYKVRHFCSSLSPDNFGFLLLTLTQLAEEHPLQDILPHVNSLLEPFDILKIYLFRNASPSLITFAVAFDSIASCQEAYLKLNFEMLLNYKVTTRFPVMDLLAYPSLPSSLKALSLNDEPSHELFFEDAVEKDTFADRETTPFSLDVSRIHTADPTPTSSPAIPSHPYECITCGNSHGRPILEAQSAPSSPLSTASGDISQPYTTLLTNQIIPWRIQAGLDSRTTCMLRNIPNKYTQGMLVDYVNETHFGLYDFLYLRMDFKNKCNVGYAFVNFVDPKTIICFSKRVKGAKWHLFNTSKIADLTYANIQGLEALIRKFRNSSVMDAPLEYRPKLFAIKGDHIGKELPFPLPDKLRNKKF